MIAECMLFLASFSTPSIGNETQFVNTSIECRQEVPESMRTHAELFLEHFDFENIDTAVRISWCESRGKANAVRTAEGNDDSGVFQFVPWTWNWVAEKYELPKWDTWVVKYNGRPYTENKVSRSSVGFEMTKVQLSPYYNILFASLLSQDIYNQVQWRDWNSSKWCWGNEKRWEKMWKAET